MNEFIYDLDDPTPEAVQRRQWELSHAAAECYGLRNAAEHYGDFARSASYHDLGDIYFGRSLALAAEWER